MIEEIEIEVARLDGYLTGIATLSGQINDYYSGAFLLHITKDETLESAILLYFKPNCQVHFYNKPIEIDWRQLESELQKFIINNILDKKTELIDSKILFDRKKYISFKIMDMIDSLISKNDFKYKNDDTRERIYRIEAKFEDTVSDFTFFYIYFGDKLLVLQFMEPHK